MKNAPDVSDVAAMRGPAGLAAEIAGAMAPPPPPPGPEPWPWLRVRDIPDPGPTKWLVEQLWTLDAFGIVGAEPKSWKSWLTLYLGICIASGRKVFNRFEVVQGRVVIFSAEGGKNLVRRRATALCNALEMEIPEEIIVLDIRMLHLDNPENAARTLSTIRALQPRLLLLDPLRELHQGDENDAATIAALLQPLRQLPELGCACMVVHHLGKQRETQRGRGAQRGGQRLRGSSALHGATDSALYLETEGLGDKKRVTVTAEHRDGAELEPFTLALRVRQLPDLQVWLEIVDKEEEEQQKIEKVVAEEESKRKQILRAVTSASKPGRSPYRSATAIYNVVKGRKTLVLSIVKDLIADGLIVVSEKGDMRPAEEAD
jgi:RecA-family ATPase